MVFMSTYPFFSFFLSTCDSVRIIVVIPINIRLKDLGKSTLTVLIMPKLTNLVKVHVEINLSIIILPLIKE